MEKLQQTQTHETAEATSRDFAEIIAEINATDVDVPDTLNSTNPEAKPAFMADPEMAVPPNTHNHLDGDVALEHVQKLRAIQDEMSESMVLSEKQKRAGQMALDFCELKNVFLLANACYNDNPSEENAEAHRMANEALYGQPDADVFRALLSERLAKIEKRKAKFSPEDEQEYAELKEMLGAVEPPETPRFRPKDETVQRFSEMAREYMEPIFAHIPEGKDEFTPEEMAQIITEAFDDFVPESSEWQVEVEPNRTNINVNQQEKMIKLAEKRPKGNLDRKGLEKLLAHEVGTHFLRALPYEDAEIGMLRTGMPGYEAFEEGVAKVMEQGIAGKYEDSGVNHYISIGLAGLKDKNFRETYEIQRRLIHLATGKEQDSLAFNSVQRAFRGTDVLPNNKDLVYYNGAEAAWKFVEEHIDDPELFDKLFLSGKSDATDAEHERLAYEARVGGV